MIKSGIFLLGLQTTLYILVCLMCSVHCVVLSSLINCSYSFILMLCFILLVKGTQFPFIKTLVYCINFTLFATLVYCIQFTFIATLDYWIQYTCIATLDYWIQFTFIATLVYCIQFLSLQLQSTQLIFPWYLVFFWHSIVFTFNFLGILVSMLHPCISLFPFVFFSLSEVSPTISLVSSFKLFNGIL